MILIKADKYEEDLKKKYPKKLKPLPRDELFKFDENKLYIVKLERPIRKSSYVYLILCIFLVLLFCTFPIWPMSMKFGIWWICIIFLSIMVQ
jgi:translocation protein SEC62